jgi:uncharacterized damage-inducible protein DinB
MQSLLSIFRTSHHVVSLSLADLSDDVARRRTRGDTGPSITWTVGHLLDARYQVLGLLGNERSRPLAETFGELAATDGAGYPPIETLRGEWSALHEELERAFATTAPGVLERPTEKVGAHGETTVRDDVAFLAWHEGYHIGVISAARLAAGLPGAADLVRAAAAKTAPVSLESADDHALTGAR